MKELVQVNGSPLAFPKLQNARDFIAAKAGITLPVHVKGTPVLTGKELLALCVKAGKTEEQVKAWRKEFDGVRKQHYVDSGMAVAMLAANPAVRKSVREARDKNGTVVGYNATFRRERSAAVGGATRIAQLEKQLADALTRLAALPAPAQS